MEFDGIGLPVEIAGAGLELDRGRCHAGVDEIPVFVPDLHVGLARIAGDLDRVDLLGEDAGAAGKQSCSGNRDDGLVHADLLVWLRVFLFGIVFLESMRGWNHDHRSADARPRSSKVRAI
ncbi:hypothetical protein D9M68_803710 [compost metagenome]